MFVGGLIHYLLDRHFHPEAANAANFEKLLTFFLAFLVIDFVTLGAGFLAWNGGTPPTRAMAGCCFISGVAAVCLSPGLLPWYCSRP